MLPAFVFYSIIVQFTLSEVEGSLTSGFLFSSHLCDERSNRFILHVIASNEAINSFFSSLRGTKQSHALKQSCVLIGGLLRRSSPQ